MQVLVRSSAKFIEPGLLIRLINTCAGIDDLAEEFRYKSSMSVKQGVENFALWYKEFY